MSEASATPRQRVERQIDAALALADFLRQHPDVPPVEWRLRGDDPSAFARLADPDTPPADPSQVMDTLTAYATAMGCSVSTSGQMPGTIFYHATALVEVPRGRRGSSRVTLMVGAWLPTSVVPATCEFIHDTPDRPPAVARVYPQAHPGSRVHACLACLSTALHATDGPTDPGAPTNRITVAELDPALAGQIEDLIYAWREAMPAYLRPIVCMTSGDTPSGGESQ